MSSRNPGSPPSERWMVTSSEQNAPQATKRLVKSVGTSVLIAAIVGPGIYGCGSAGSTVSPGASNPTPTIATVSPTSGAAGGTNFTLTVNGTNFVTASIVNFGGMAAPTLFVSSTQLTAAISSTAIASAGAVSVTVTSPTPGGGTSNAVTFTIGSGPNPVPAIASLDPSCATIGAPAFTLYVSGSNFVAGSVVRWNGSNLQTTVVDASNAAVQVPASEIAASGTAAVTVFNPTPGGGISNASAFTMASGPNPQSIAVDPTGKFAYVANEGCPDLSGGSVTMYTIDTTTGTLTSIGSPVTTPVGPDDVPHSVAVDPTGKFAYVANWSDFTGSISMYKIDGAAGALTSTGTINAPCAPPPSPGSCAPYSVAVHPSGKFAYVANEGGFTPTSVSMYTINAATGALASIGTIAAGGRAISVTVDPSGKFAYVADGSSNSDGSPGVNVSMYTINATTGALASMGTIAAGVGPTSIAIDPSGKFAYVANSGSNDVSLYTIDVTTGTLASIGTPAAAGTNPGSVAVDPSGKFAYVANRGSNNVSMYSIDAATGALTSIGTIAAELTPSSIAIHPSGKFAYVTNSGSNNLSMYSIDAATGELTLIGTIGT